MNNQKEKEVCFNLVAADETVMDVQKHPPKQAEETTKIDECLNEQSTSIRTPILRNTLENLKHKPTKLNHMVSFGIIYVL